LFTKLPLGADPGRPSSQIVRQVPKLVAPPPRKKGEIKHHGIVQKWFLSTMLGWVKPLKLCYYRPFHIEITYFSFRKRPFFQIEIHPITKNNFYLLPKKGSISSISTQAEVFFRIHPPVPRVTRVVLESGSRVREIRSLPSVWEDSLQSICIPASVKLLDTACFLGFRRLRTVEFARFRC
jgi:hypothetical protein